MLNAWVEFGKKRKMKGWSDNIEFEKVVNMKIEELKSSLLVRVEESKLFHFSIGVDGCSFSLKSKKLDWISFPPQHSYRIKIKLVSPGEDKTKICVKVKGNVLFVFFKYLAIVLLVFWMMAAWFDLSDFVEIDETLIGPVLVVVLLNYLNDENLKEGEEQIMKIISACN